MSWLTCLLKKDTPRVKVTREEAQREIDGLSISGMIMDFHTEFREEYDTHVHVSSMCSVGPLQSMIGLAIKNGYLKLGDTL